MKICEWESREEIRQAMTLSVGKEWKCPKCKGLGYYTIAVSNPNYPSEPTTTVPCDCVFSEHGQELIREGRAMSDRDIRRGE